MPVFFFSDLDNTLIYSYKHNIGMEKICVEIYEGREISFITSKTKELLQDMISSTLHFIPITTRTPEQYQRIQFPIPTPEYALTCNGGILLVNGEIEKDWYSQSLELVKPYECILKKASEILEKEERRFLDVRFLHQLFVFTKCYYPKKVVESLSKQLNHKEIEVRSVGDKIYVIPKVLDKAMALKRWVQRYSILYSIEKEKIYTISAGDSDFDIGMIKEANLGICTTKLYHQYIQSIKIKENIIAMPHRTNYAEEILEKILEVINIIERKK